MKTMYVYILKCSDDTFYTGVTNNLERRIIEHNAGISKESYTYSRKPLQLVFYVMFNDPKTAIAYEKKIKKWSRAKKQALIDSKFDSLPKLSKKEFK
ncbi:MAG: GIY-YIG nuclease family protein [Bacteroidia bacterium]|nr:GIY-YIG nuclease family protein [Bacteroidia bacterium]